MFQINFLAIVVVLAVGQVSEASYGSGANGYSCPSLFNYYGDVNDCSKFYRCFWGQAYVFYCPRGTRWSQTLLSCDHDYNVPCHGASSYVPQPASKPDYVAYESYSSNNAGYGNSNSGYGNSNSHYGHSSYSSSRYGNDYGNSNSGYDSHRSHYGSYSTAGHGSVNHGVQGRTYQTQNVAYGYDQPAAHAQSGYDSRGYNYAKGKRTFSGYYRKSAGHYRK